MIQALGMPSFVQEQPGGGCVDQLRAGEMGTVWAIDTAQPSAKRLADLGFVRGATVVMIRPGSPCIIRIDHRYVGLGRAFQACIQLAPSVPERCPIASEAMQDSRCTFRRTR